MIRIKTKVKWLMLFGIILLHFPDICLSQEQAIISELDTTEIGTPQYFKAREKQIAYYLSNSNNNIDLDSLTEDLIAVAIKYDNITYHTYGLFVKAQLYKRANEYNKALYTIIEAVDLSKQGATKTMQSTVLSYYGLILHYGGEYDQSISILKEDAAFCLEHNLEDRLWKSYYYLASIYQRMLKIFITDGETDPVEKDKLVSNAMKYFDLAIAENSESEKIQMEQIGLQLLLEDYDNVISSANTLLKSDLVEGKEDVQMRLYQILAEANFAINNKKLANQHIQQGIDIAIGMGKISDLKILFNIQYDWAKTDKNFELALENRNRYFDLSDSLWNIEKKTEFRELALKYENEKKADENNMLSAEKAKLKSSNFWLTIFTLSLLASLLALVYLYLRNKKQSNLIIEQKEQLEKLDKLKSSFFENVSHELRTPLTIILGPINAILKREKLDSEDSRFLMMAKQSGQQLLEMVNQLLDFSKLEKGKMKLEESNTKIYLFIKNLIEPYQLFAESQGVKFTYEIAIDENAIATLDVYKFKIIFNNLMSNAFKFTKVPGSIHVSVQKINGSIQVNISDTGRGIHPKDIKHIFDRFYQSDYEPEMNMSGSGIGLAVSKEYALVLGGELSVESELGKGSTFCLTIPYKETIHSEQDHSNNAEHKKELEANGHILENEVQLVIPDSISQGKTIIDSRPKILVIEDNSNLREYLQFILSEQYQVSTAINGQDALQILDGQEFSPDNLSNIIQLVITDIMMPDMNGIQLIESLKSNQKYKKLPIIVVSAKTAMDDKLNALRIGVDDYIIKPFSEDELIIRIKNLLNNHTERKEAVKENISKEKLAVESVWLLSLEKIIEDRLADSSFKIDEIPSQLAMSRSQFYRVMKEETGLSPNLYLREIKLQKARRIMQLDQRLSVKEVCHSVGFEKPSYFSELFKARFGTAPSEYKENFIT
jgi:signal transduction histidine kinase/DNA-binding response OmpR family regulator